MRAGISMTEISPIEQAVTFMSEGAKLSGTLTVPRSETPVPVILMLPGSGRTDRDDNAKWIAIDLFPRLIPVLTEGGFATFRYDKRGVGASEGDYWSSGFDDRFADAAGAIGWLAGRPEVDPSRIFALGHSEGALIAVRLAASKKTIAGIVLLGASAKVGEETLLWQGRQIAPTITGLNKAVLGILHIDPLKLQQKNINRLKATTRDVVRIQLQRTNAKWVREFLAYDPAPDLANVHAPVLAITGANDIQVDPDDLHRMAELIPADFESHVVPVVTHLLRADPDHGGLRDYRRQAKQPIDARVVGYVADWLERKANGTNN
jgi:uncharacterized protein